MEVISLLLEKEGLFLNLKNVGGSPELLRGEGMASRGNLWPTACIM